MSTHKNLQITLSSSESSSSSSDSSSSESSSFSGSTTVTFGLAEDSGFPALALVDVGASIFASIVPRKYQKQKQMFQVNNLKI